MFCTCFLWGCKGSQYNSHSCAAGPCQFMRMVWTVPYMLYIHCRQDIQCVLAVPEAPIRSQVSPVAL